MLLLTDLERGGTPNRIARTARALDGAGATVAVACLAREGPVGGELRRAGIPVLACGATSARDLGAIARLIRYVRAFRPDVLHATLTHANVAARLAATMCGVPVITSTATVEVERRWHRVAEVLTDRLLPSRLDGGHVVNSEAVAGHVRRAFGLARASIHVIPPVLDFGSPMSDTQTMRTLHPPGGPNERRTYPKPDRGRDRQGAGAEEPARSRAQLRQRSGFGMSSGAAPERAGDALRPSGRGVVSGKERDAIRRALGVAEHEFLVMWVGRFDPVKRMELVIRAAEMLTDVPARWAIVGDGPLHSQVENMVRLSSAARRIEMLGWREDAPRLVSAADALILPSRTEGVPNAALEALSQAVPVVASDIAPNRALADSGGVILVRENDGSGYARELRSLARNPQRRAAMGQAAAEWVKRTLDGNLAVNRLVALYEQVLSRRAPGGRAEPTSDGGRLFIAVAKRAH